MLRSYGLNLVPFSRSPLYIQSRTWIALRAKIDSRANVLLQSLIETEEQLSGTYRMMDIKAFLYSVASEYSQLRQELNAKTKVSDAQAPLQIDTSTISALGDIGQILPFLFSRLSSPSTYVYAFLALILDLTLIAAFIPVVRSEADPRQRVLASAPRQI